MSFRRPQVSYRRKVKSSASTSPAADNLASSSSLRLGATRRPRNSKGLLLPGPEALITLPGGLSLTQMPLDDHAECTGGSKRRRRYSSSESETSHGNADDPNIICTGNPDNLISTMEGDANESLVRLRRQRKKARLSAKWTTDIIPALIPVYLRLLRETESLRLSPNLAAKSSCSCTSVRPLTVTGVFFQREFFISSPFHFV
jgi:hypothetical protein